MLFDVFFSIFADAATYAAYFRAMMPWLFLRALGIRRTYGADTTISIWLLLIFAAIRFFFATLLFR